jgi:Dna[CI] antecedent DciA-like protein
MERISGRSLAARLFGASPARTLALLEAAWPLAVGPELARRTEVLGIEGGTLRVRVPDAGWRKVLHRMQPQILGHLREIAGDLAPRRMGFVEGGLAAEPTAVSAPADRPQSAAASRSGGAARGGFQGGSSLHSESVVSSPPEIKNVAATIDDTEIRTRFLEVATRYLERSKGRNDA